jgi:dephospho-CoA kinase
LFGGLALEQRADSNIGSQSDITAYDVTHILSGIEPDQAANIARDIAVGKASGIYPGKLKTEYGKFVMTPKQRVIEASFNRWLEENLEEAERQYWQHMQSKKSGEDNVLNVDEVRELSPEYRADRTKNAIAVHEPSSAFKKYLFQKYIELDPNKVNRIVGLAGGAGSGKSSAVRMMDDLFIDAKLVVDGVMSKPDSTINDIEAALAAGNEYHVVYVFRDVADAAVANMERALPKLNKQTKKMENQRIVIVDEVIKGHIGALDTVLMLHKKYKDNPDVHFTFLDNSGEKDTTKEISIENLEQKRYTDKESTRKRVYNAINARIDQGGIPKAVIAALQLSQNAGREKANPVQPGRQGSRADAYPYIDGEGISEPLGGRDDSGAGVQQQHQQLLNPDTDTTEEGDPNTLSQQAGGNPQPDITTQPQTGETKVIYIEELTQKRYTDSESTRKRVYNAINARIKQGGIPEAVIAALQLSQNAGGEEANPVQPGRQRRQADAYPLADNRRISEPLGGRDDSAPGVQQQHQQLLNPDTDTTEDGDPNTLSQQAGGNLQPDITTQPQPGEPQMTEPPFGSPQMASQFWGSEVVDMSNPLGEVPLNGTPSPEPYGSTLQEIYQDVRPLLARAREAYKQSMDANRQFKLGEIDPASQAEVRKWLKQVQNDMSGVKYAALNHGEALRDAALLNYSRRYGLFNSWNHPDRIISLVAAVGIHDQVENHRLSIQE